MKKYITKYRLILVAALLVRVIIFLVLVWVVLFIGARLHVSELGADIGIAILTIGMIFMSDPEVVIDARAKLHAQRPGKS